MAKFVFIGNGKNDPDQITIGNYVFPLNKTIEVKDDVLGRLKKRVHGKVITIEKTLLTMLRGNPHFKEVKNADKGNDSQ